MQADVEFSCLRQLQTGNLWLEVGGVHAASETECGWVQGRVGRGGATARVKHLAGGGGAGEAVAGGGLQHR